MKTNQIMTRKMGDFDVFQRTKDGMFNATSLLKQWNSVKGNPKRDLSKFWELQNTKEFLQVLEKDEEFTNTPKKGYLKSRGKKDSEFLNKRNSPYLKTRGKNGGTWMHPYLFIKFAMWLNPKFELQVIKFVHDQLVKFRQEAGDNYRPFCKAINKIYPNCDFSEPAKWLNFVVFNSHEKNIRNKAEQEQLDELSRLEKKYTDLIEEGYIKDVIVLKEKLRGEWRLRHSGMPLALAQ